MRARHHYALPFPAAFLACFAFVDLPLPPESLSPLIAAVALADPFGGDDVDFETELYMANILANMKAQISGSADYPNVFLPLTTGHKALAAAKAK